MPNAPRRHVPPGMPTRAEQARAYKQTPKGREANRRYARARWRKVRNMVLSRQPICERQTHCNGDPATEVHHVVPVEVDPTREFDLENLMALCRGCHNAMRVDDVR